MLKCFDSLMFFLYGLLVENNHVDCLGYIGIFFLLLGNLLINFNLLIYNGAN